MATPVLLYISENKLTSQNAISRTQTAEMKSQHKVRGFTKLDRICNEEIKNEVQIFSSKKIYRT
jgi:hypothetical protein